MNLPRNLLVATLLTGLLIACGQKGPLYLPDSSQEQAPPTAEEDDEPDDGA